MLAMSNPNLPLKQDKSAISDAQKQPDFFLSTPEKAKCVQNLAQKYAKDQISLNFLVRFLSLQELVFFSFFGGGEGGGE